VTTYLMRHGRTQYSAAYRVNGDPRVAVPLDAVGVQQCRAARTLVPAKEITVCLTSGFARTVESADQMLDGHAIPRHAITGLGEIDYGQFEGRLFADYAAWLTEHGSLARPPGSRESQRDAIARMLGALRMALHYPGPRLVITHGLLVSIIEWLRANETGRLSDLLFFPEAPCAVPVRIGDLELTRLLDRVAGLPSCDNRAQRREDPERSNRQRLIRPQRLPSGTPMHPSEAQARQEGNPDA
jgi:probable phosphoglycerate mutase